MEAQGSAFAALGVRLEGLADAFALETQTSAALRAAYRAVLLRGLDAPIGGLRPGVSRLAQDGTPVQFATAVGPAPPAVRFVGDVGPSGAGGAERMRTAHVALADLAAILGVERELAALTPLIAELAPETARPLLDDAAGAFWMGASFARGIAPRMRLYVNGAWGGPEAAHARLARFAAWFDGAEAWSEIRRRMPVGLAPLGVALTMAAGRTTRGTIYLRAFGLRLADYVQLAAFASGDANAEAVYAFGTSLLGSDSVHPTASAVLSFGFGAGSPSTELELCAHCLFHDDAEAETRLLALFREQNLDAWPYRALVNHLSSGARHGKPPRLHSFVGMDARALGPAWTVYVTPDVSAPG